MWPHAEHGGPGRISRRAVADLFEPPQGMGFRDDCRDCADEGLVTQPAGQAGGPGSATKWCLRYVTRALRRGSLGRASGKARYEIDDTADDRDNGDVNQAKPAATGSELCGCVSFLVPRVTFHGWMITASVM